MFETPVHVLMKDPQSLLAQLCGPEPPIAPDSADDCFYFDRDWWLFRYVLQFLRDGVLPEDRSLLTQVKSTTCCRQNIYCRNYCQFVANNFCIYADPYFTSFSFLFRVIVIVCVRLRVDPLTKAIPRVFILATGANAACY